MCVCVSIYASLFSIFKAIFFNLSHFVYKHYNVFFWCSDRGSFYPVKSTISGKLLTSLPKLKQIIAFLSLLQGCINFEFRKERPHKHFRTLNLGISRLKSLKNLLIIIVKGSLAGAQILLKRINLMHFVKSNS